MTRPINPPSERPSETGNAKARPSREGRAIPARGEPDLSEMLADPIVKSLMKYDGVDAEALHRLFAMHRR